MEFVFSYGWALVVMMVAVASLSLFVFDGGDNLVSTVCNFGPGLFCNEFQVSAKVNGGTYNSNVPDIPQKFLNMASYSPIRNYYIAINEPCANNSNDGLSYTCDGQGGGPWKDFEALNVRFNQGFLFEPGDALVFRSGIYELSSSGLNLKNDGLENAPIKFMAFTGDNVVMRVNQNPLLLAGKYTVLEGLKIECNVLKECIVVFDQNDSADHIVVYNNEIIGATEDGIKSTNKSSNLFVYRNKFYDTRGAGESIDAFGVQEAWIVENEFYEENLQGSNPGAVMWTKGGAKDIYYIRNHFHDFTVENHAVILGGCCWENWNGVPGVDYVAERVYAYDNIFERINISGSYAYRGVIGVSGCKDCIVEGNVLNEVDDVIGIHSSEDGPIKLASKNVVIRNNKESNVNNDRVLNLHADSTDGLLIEGNEYCVNDPHVYYGGNLMALPDFMNYGFELNYNACGSNSSSGVNGLNLVVTNSLGKDIDEFFVYVKEGTGESCSGNYGILASKTLADQGYYPIDNFEKDAKLRLGTFDLAGIDNEMNSLVCEEHSAVFDNSVTNCCNTFGDLDNLVSFGNLPPVECSSACSSSSLERGDLFSQELVLVYKFRNSEIFHVKHVETRSLVE